MGNVLFGIYDEPQHAEAVVQRLLAAGCTHNDIRVFGPELRAQALGQEHSAFSTNYQQTEREGSFADVDPHYHDKRVEREGSFADVDPHYHDEQAEREGSFADVDPHYHDEQAEREGSFADVDPGNYQTRNIEREGAYGDVGTQPDPSDTLLSQLINAGLAEAEAAHCALRIGQGSTLVMVTADPANEQRVADIIAGH